MSVPFTTEPGTVSPDGHHVWTGANWLLLIRGNGAQGSGQPGAVSDDGHYYWTGMAWASLISHQPMEIEHQTRQAAYREPTYDNESDDEQQAVNTHGLDDNCYFVTAAFLGGVTVDGLIQSTETLQNRGGASLDAISALFNAAGLTPTYVTFYDLEAVTDHLHDTSGGLDRRYGLAFTRGDSSGHMVVANWNATDQAFSYTDYQMNPSGADAAGDVATGREFHLFGPQ